MVIEKQVKENLLASSRAMAEVCAKGIGPDVVIIVSSTTNQADFWQGHLTAGDNVHSSGANVKRDTIVLSVTESNWAGGAGNGLGTLNGFLQAARKARELSLIDAKDEDLIDAFLGYSKGKSVFMYHTAGKGTRMAPLPGAECNSKPNIKLPKIVEDDGKRRPITILEAVLMETSVYAPSRKNRLSVFWGDQIVINELNVSFEGKHHIEIFGELMPLTESIKDYGVLIPTEAHDCMQREKLSIEEVKALLPEGKSEVYRSIGSFTVSLAFLKALLGMDYNKEYLAKAEGEINTDPDWWQPLTSTREEYVTAMTKKGIDEEEAASRWDEMDEMWQKFSGSDSFNESGLDHKFGFNDVGENSLWWDYGQNLYYLEGMRMISSASAQGEIARSFLGIDENAWIDELSDVKDAEVTDSVVQDSKIEGGKLVNCVVVNSYLKNVVAKDAVIISSYVLDLNAQGALCYNVVDKRIELDKGKALVNIFHPEKGRIPMMTDVSRDGKADWKNKELIYDNTYTYPQVADLMKDVAMDVSEEVKKKEIEKLKP